MPSNIKLMRIHRKTGGKCVNLAIVPVLKPLYFKTMH